MLARVPVLAMALCMSVTSLCSIKRDEQINLDWPEGLFRPVIAPPTLCLKEIQVQIPQGKGQFYGDGVRLGSNPDDCKGGCAAAMRPFA